MLLLGLRRNGAKDDLRAATACRPVGRRDDELRPLENGQVTAHRVRVQTQRFSQRDMVLKDVTIEIAPGIKYNAWGFEGGAPGPVVHARQGQTVEMTLTNKGAIPHSIDFHAARIAPNLAFVDVAPGESFTFTFKANDPGVTAAESRPLVRARGERVVSHE